MKNTVENLIDQIHREFSQFRNGQTSRRPRLPQHLKELVLLAHERGLPAEKINAAAGIGKGSVSRWQAKAKKGRGKEPEQSQVAVRELRLVGHYEPAPTPVAAPDGATIHIGPLITISLPASAFRGEWLMVLAKAGGQP